MKFLILLLFCYFTIKALRKKYEIHIEAKAVKDILSDIDLEKIGKMIDDFSAKHPRNPVHIKIKDKFIEIAINPILCENCQTYSLVIRNGKFGNFYGCKNFPKCRYTKDIKNEFI